MISRRVAGESPATHGVRQAAVVEHLEQHVEHVRVRLLDLVEEHDRVRAPPHLLGEEPALFVADVAGRRAEEPRHRELLHVLGHVDPDQRVLVAEQVLGEGPGQLGLADAGRAQEDERAHRPLGVLEARPASGGSRATTAATASSWPTMRPWSASSMRASLADSFSSSLRQRDAGPAGHDVLDVLLADRLGRPCPCSSPTRA